MGHIKGDSETLYSTMNPTNNNAKDDDCNSLEKHVQSEARCEPK